MRHGAARFPHGATDFINSTMAGGSVLILAPPTFGLIYYVFDFGIARAMFLTLLAMAHSVLIPLQLFCRPMSCTSRFCSCRFSSSSSGCRWRFW
jgi:hypothetical protein